MPTYEYACKKCGEQFDVVQSFSDEPLKRHKGCGGAVRRVFGSVGISFKGSGFYKNDSRSGSSKSSSSFVGVQERIGRGNEDRDQVGIEGGVNGEGNKEGTQGRQETGQDRVLALGARSPRS